MQSTIDTERDALGKAMRKNKAKEKLQKVHTYLKEEKFEEHFLKYADFENYEEYVDALSLLADKTAVLMKGTLAMPG